jgi:hypothetical protein
VKYHVRDAVYMMIVASYLRGTLGNAPRVVFNLRGMLGNAPHVVFILRGTLGNAPRVVFNSCGTLGNAPHILRGTLGNAPRVVFIIESTDLQEYYRVSFKFPQVQHFKLSFVIPRQGIG